jgi:hypothetical protein
MHSMKAAVSPAALLCCSRCSAAGHTAEIFCDAQLPLSLKELQCGRLPSADAVLPLRYLQRLDILSCRSTAAELARLSSLTALTHIGLRYVDSETVNWDFYVAYLDGDQLIAPEAASQAWPALAGQLRKLHIIEWRSGCDELPYSLSTAAVAALGNLSILTSLKLKYLQCPEVQPEQLAAALRRCTALQELELGELQLQWRHVEDLTGDADEDEALLDEAQQDDMQVVAAAIASLPRLQKLRLCKLPVDMHAAVKLAAATQLTHLSLERCDGLSDCGMSALALGMTNLKSLELQSVDVGDAALPALARLPLQRLRLSNCHFDYVALDLFVPAWRALRNAP